MNLSIPIYVEGLRAAGGSTIYQARPLFFYQPVVRGERLERLLTRLAQDIGRQLGTLGRQARHEELAAWTFAPPLRTQRIDLTLTLRRRTARCRFLFVSFRHFGRHLAFTPSVPEVWFDLSRGETMTARASEVLTRHFRDREREEGDIDPEALSVKGMVHVTPLELTVRPPVVPPEPPMSRFLMLGGEAPASGADELRRVGRCLDWQYPDELARLVRRDAELAELTRLLDSGENRPLLLLGPRLVGKTALLEEFVYRRVEARRSAFRDRGNVWLLAPARLISGMSYVGQWEDRLLAILKEARRRKHILYFDDLLGLFLAGRSASSTLSVADVLKPFLERREVQFVAEITPGALRVLRERDRGFADLFHLLPLSEPTEGETLRILIDVQRRLEGRHRCRFGMEVLPVVIDLQRRYGRETAFPGKAAAFLHQLAARNPDDDVVRVDVLNEFHLRSGLAVTFLDRHVRLDRQDVLGNLRRQVIGQDAALEAVTDAIGIAKARLNDPARPLGVFLFLGPTGVGKTECAKAVARYLFGADDRLLRFDLNEYSEPGSAARLVGTFDRPEGLLTSAIRRQPFTIVLFDEVEKADPEVFDLLLQVLGEGRLTDALGRTADFSNALIVLTSNLGVRAAEATLGYREDGAARDAAYVRAAEQFFRPEFFNRLDRVIPFRRLGRDEVRKIARKVIEGVFAREGLVQRKCLLSVEEPALEWVVDHGYEPALGARALKRAVERHLAQPVAEQLAELPPGAFTVVRVYPGRDGLAVHVRPLEQVLPIAPWPDLNDTERLLGRIRSALRRIEDDLAPLRPPGELTLGQVSAEHYRYYVVRDLVDELRDRVRELAAAADEARLTRIGMPSFRKPDPPHPTRKWKKCGDEPPGRVLRAMASASDIHSYLKELIESATAATGPHSAELQLLLAQLSLLHRIAESVRSTTAERAVLWPVGLGIGRGDAAAKQLFDSYLTALPVLRLEVEVGDLKNEQGTTPFPERCLVLNGPHALAVAQGEAGVHLLCPAHGAVEPVLMLALPVEGKTEPITVARAWMAQRQSWLEALARGEADAAGDPLNPGAVLRLYPERTPMVDLRSGLTTADLAACLLASLPLPPELSDQADLD